MSQLKIKVILASIRPNRFGVHPANWITELASMRESLSVELLDLAEYALPDFAEPVSPAHVIGAYSKPEVNVWAAKIAEADAFIVVTPEYNNGYPAVLKNAIDHIYKEWNKKPIAFVGYGATGGARVITQLRMVATELQMAPIRNSVHIFFPWNLVEADGSLKAGVFDSNVKNAGAMLDQLSWWADALRNART